MVILHNIQNIKMNYFELFGLPIGFQVDTIKLRAAFMAIQRASHPDKFTQGSLPERRLSTGLVTRFHRLKVQVMRS